MKPSRPFVLFSTLLLFGVLFLGCAHQVDRGVYHFNWVVKVVDHNEGGRLPGGAQTITLARKDWSEDNRRWEITAYSICYDLSDMEYEMSLMMQGLTDYVVGVGPVWPQRVEQGR